jgi:hypothetical protein
MGLAQAASLVSAAVPSEWHWNGRDLGGWRQPTGDWRIVGSVAADPTQPEKFVITPGQGVLLNGAGGRTVNLLTEAEYGDVELHVEFCIPKRSNSGVYLMGRYEIQVYDSHGTAQDPYPGIECGGIYPRWIDEKNVDGHSPRVNASRPPGEWQAFDITFRAPRFDASGKKTASARMVKVVHNGRVVHENVELHGPTRAAQWEDEKPLGPILLQGDHGPVAYRNVRVSPLAPATAPSASKSNPAYPPRLKRADSFLGVHFDFHAGKDCTAVGQNTTRRMIESIIDQVRPDYLQVDCKGHAGFSSYPTRVGHPAPGFVGDPLRLWRQVTAERGVALYMHYSGVWDSEAIRLHPDWAAVNADGKPNGNATSFFGRYADRLLIPQLRELAGDYGVDGAWVDGECWASVPDYGEAALRAFREATGISEVPRKPGDPHWYEFLQFNREAFRKYLRHYIAEVKQTNPDMQLCSNWAFTDHMPEPVCAPVDFLSGDYSPEDSVSSARFSARYLARQGKPWDLMAWSFARSPGASGSRQKSAVQLQREAAVVLALGGGFQAYFKQKRDGSIFEEQMPVMAEVATFCRARQAICHHAMPVPQVALLYSTAAHYREINGLFSRDLNRMRGTLQALLEGQQSVEVLGEHHLVGRLSQYPMIVLPEVSHLDAGFKKDLVAYVRAGGTLLLVGPSSASLFPEELGMSADAPPESGTRYLAYAGQWTPTKGQVRRVSLHPNTRRVGQLHTTQDPRSPSHPAASIARLGRGNIAATYFAFSQGYLADRSATARLFLNDLARQLFPEPIVEVKGSSDVDVAVNRINGRLAVNLVNTAGPHADVKAPIHETIPPVGPLEILIRTPRKPTSIRLEPGGQSMHYQYRQGEARLTLPQLEIHSVIVVDAARRITDEVVR